MSPETPAVLAELLKLAEISIDMPSGSERIKQHIDAVIPRIQALLDGMPQESPRLVNEFTMFLAQSMRIAESEMPFGDANVVVRACTLGTVLLPFVQKDMLAAMELNRPATSEHERAR